MDIARTIEEKGEYSQVLASILNRKPMIKFFRKIRQRLLTENKFSKYLIYAIGEILLVVLGILIAVQINKANNDQINRNLGRFYLEGIVKDIRVDLIRLDEIIFFRFSKSKFRQLYS